MEISLRTFLRATLLLISVLVLIFTASRAKGQTSQEVATAMSPSTKNTASPTDPVFSDYRGVKIGMSAEEVRATLNNVKKGEGQDFLVFSERESAQIYYDDKGKVMAISIDYFGENSNAPAPDVVLGVGLQAKPDGSMYQLNRYPEAGFWVSYNRTAGDKPIVTITMQKM
jgi:hypothetical protein